MAQRMESHALAQPGAPGNVATAAEDGGPGQRPGSVAAGIEEPGLRSEDLPVLPQSRQQLGGKHHIAILLPFALTHADDHALTVDVSDLQGGGFRAPQPGAVDGHEYPSELELHLPDRPKESTYLRLA